MIKVQNLSKKFGRVKAVDDLSFEIGRGEVVGFLGPNGAGKTTTMRLLTGFLFADQGRVEVGGLEVEKYPLQAQKLVGYLPEENPLYKEMLVKEFLELGADLGGLSKVKRQQAFDFVVPAMGLANYFYRPLGELSKGYRQRAGLAVALLHQPPVLILDEPTQGLDPNQRAEIRALIKKIGEDRTVIMSTHVMQEVTAICSRIIIINKGELVADGTADELSSAYKKELVVVTEIEGSEVIPLLQALKEVKELQVESLAKNRARLRLTASGRTQLQPLLSSLAREKNWTIWHLAEEKQELEELFQEITQSAKGRPL